MNEEMELEVFRAGDYGDKGAWSEAELDAIAESYSASRHEAPVTLDHAQSGPSLGWVAGLRRAGDRLVAKLRGVHPELARALREGTFRKRSVELYHNLAGTGGPYLKAVSFLGAAAPAVRGLTDPIFGESGNSVRFREDNGGYSCFALPNPEESGKPDDSRTGNGKTGSGAAGVTEEETTFAETRDDLRRSGRWNPRWDGMGIREFHAAIRGIDGVNISGRERVSLADWFADFLRSLPSWLPVGEAAPGKDGQPSFVAGNIPFSDNVSTGSILMHRKVCALREIRPELNYGEALLHCSREA